MKEIEGDLIKLAKEGEFDMIAQGCNCFCTMGAGIAKQIKEEFPEAWEIDQTTLKGDINKLGNYTIAECYNEKGEYILDVLNCYTQYMYGSNHLDGDQKPVDYDAITLVMRKINHQHKGRSIGLPLIGAGLAGGDWKVIKTIIETELKDMDVTIVHYKK